MLDKRKTEIDHGCIQAKPVTSGSGRGVLIPHSALFSRQSRVPNFSHPEYRFLFHYRIPCRNFDESCFPGSWVKSRISSKKLCIFPNPALYLVESRMPGIPYRPCNVNFHYPSRKRSACETKPKESGQKLKTKT